MNILIVHAHPEPLSFTTALKDHAVQVLENIGHAVEVSDLYAINFNPVASQADFDSRSNQEYLNYALEQRHASKTHDLAQDIQIEIEKVQKADLLIFSFPMYWTSVPAILKGWIDRVFVSGIFYGGKRFYNRGGMLGKKAMLSFTLGGRDHMFGQNAIHGAIDDLLLPIQRGTLAYVGFEVLPPFIAYHVPYITDEARQQLLQQYQQHLQNLEQLQALEFPKLEQFDDKLYPL
ncbi:NAD(P)H-dependent oxidoreductase [Acinetobacter bereziniae]|uniref:NAD(P)H-dependent oxidoreductase n=1 Tax=Acinetobacter bereziniae TaxID=106648 RepID=UPI000C2BF5CD|nr:NAD(P)H-dependent oxidoreductase [Acinetobacter bereziniae]ATZ65372.1 NAD(P)H dehydrogenase [Acinetobacter bereziniae]MDR6541076.1 NAD(P)H dehydrogenase (quinone) [Acinetobacter bereziniae]